MYFKDQFQVSGLGDKIRWSIKITDYYVVEHTIPASSFRKIFELEDTWVGDPIIQSKRVGNKVFIRVKNNVQRCDVYCLKKAEFNWLLILFNTAQGI